MIYDETAMNNGAIFLHAHNVLSERMMQGLNGATQGDNVLSGESALDASLFVPVVVNGSLACELFMKSMLPQRMIAHKLDEIFNALNNTDLQGRIRQSTIAKMKHSNESYCATDFQNDLGINNNIFIEWRYFHEGNSHPANLQFIDALLNSLHEIVMEERGK